METKLKATRHGGIALLFVILVMMGCVQTEALLPSAEIQTDSNIDAARFIEILNKQPHQLAAFKEKVVYQRRLWLNILHPIWRRGVFHNFGRYILPRRK